MNLKEIIVDANKGKIIINPTKETFETYKNFRKIIKVPEKINAQNSMNNEFNLYANISNAKEIDLILDKNICGIGLLRTELFFLNNKEIPNEEIQFLAYKKIAQKLKNKPFIIRLFDLGADKTFYGSSKKNGCDFFGCRGIRYLLENQAILEMQIKSILRTSNFGNIYMLIPFVSDVKEIVRTKKIFNALQKQLNLDDSIVKIGSMIETPAAALNIDEIIGIVDFISIGTNDLTRYTMASQNIESDQLPKPLEKLLKIVIEASKINNKPLFLCGEMPAKQGLLSKLLGLGISNVSLGVKHIEMFEKFKN